MLDKCGEHREAAARKHSYCCWGDWHTSVSKFLKFLGCHQLWHWQCVVSLCKSSCAVLRMSCPVIQMSFVGWVCATAWESIFWGHWQCCLHWTGSYWKVQSDISYRYQIFIGDWSSVLCCLCNTPLSGKQLKSSGADWLQCFMLFQQCMQLRHLCQPNMCMVLLEYSYTAANLSQGRQI